MRYREDNINIIIISISLSISISISMELEEVSSVQFNGLSCQQIPKQSTPNNLLVALLLLIAAVTEILATILASEARLNPLALALALALSL